MDVSSSNSIINHQWRIFIMFITHYLEGFGLMGPATDRTGYTCCAGPDIGSPEVTTHQPHKYQPEHELRTSQQCPKGCECTLTKETITGVNCAHSNRDRIPSNIPVSTEKVDLSYNKIKTIPANIFKNLAHLSTLDMSHNIITQLQNDSFQGLSNVKLLSLAFNKLETFYAYSDSAFTPLRNVKELHIEGNCNPNISLCDYPKSAMRSLRSLEILHQDGYPERKLPAEYGSLTNLKVLVMTGQRLGRGYCRIASLSRDILKSIETTKLTTLEMSSCQIDTIQPLTFARFTNLTTLNLTSNENLCAQGLSNLTVGLSSTDIKRLILKLICHTFPGPLTTGIMENLGNTKLEHLDISNSYIQYIDPMNILQLPVTLKYLSLRCNAINNVNFLLIFSVMESLEYLDISFQASFQTLKEEANTDNCRVNNTVVRKLALNEPERDHSVVESMSVLNIDRSNSSIMQSMLNVSHPHWPVIIPLPPKLRIVYASHLKLATAIPPIVFNSHNVIEELHLSYNMFSSMQGAVSGLHELKYIDLSHNEISFIDENTFGDAKYLRRMDLQSNRLGQYLIDRQTKQNFLINQTRLETLDLSSNGIRDLPTNIFTDLKALKNLTLRDNALTSLNCILDEMRELRFIDLSANQIQFLSDTSMSMLNRIAGPLQIDIHDNILVCSCDHRLFMKWLTSDAIMFSNRGNITCQSSNSSLISLPELTRNFKELEMECYTLYILIGCISGFLFLTILLCFVAALYSQRWKIRYLYYIGRHRINPYHTIEEIDVDTNYDIYISFDDSFHFPSGRCVYNYVTTCLYPQLKDRGLRVIIREELTGGKFLHDVISSAIRSSDKVVVMLTAKFCKEFWNTFEFNMAAYEGIYTMRNVIIPVLMETAAANDMTPEIWAYCRNQKMLAFEEARSDEFIDLLENIVNKR